MNWILGESRRRGQKRDTRFRRSCFPAPRLTSLTFLGMDSRMSSPSFRIVLPHSSICSDTGTEYGIGGRIWLLGLSGSSEHDVTTAVAGSSLTGMGVAKGAGMH